METAPQPLAVTVAITRRADPSRNAEMLAWVRSGTTLAEDFPGPGRPVRRRAGSRQ